MIQILPVFIASLFILLILLIVTIKNRFAFKPIQPISNSTIKDAAGDPVSMTTLVLYLLHNLLA